MSFKNDEATLQLIAHSNSQRFVSYSYFVQWVQKNGEIRVPEETESIFKYPGQFTAAGKNYSSIDALCVKSNEDGELCEDIYGRRVYAVKERFPCFDSYDYLHENRYYRWFLIEDDGKLSCVKYTDQRDELRVTEDVHQLNERCYKMMEKYVC